MRAVVVGSVVIDPIDESMWTAFWKAGLDSTAEKRDAMSSSIMPFTAI